MHTIQSVFPIRRHVLGVFFTGDVLKVCPLPGLTAYDAVVSSGGRAVTFPGGASLSADGLWNTAAATAAEWGAPEP